MATGHRWIMRPLEGLGPLRLGMTRTDVGALLDAAFPVRAVHRAFDGSTDEFRTLECPVCNYRDDVLQAIDTDARVPDVMWNGADVYAMEARLLLQMFERASDGAKADLGFVLFDSISVNTRGLYDEKDGTFIEPDDPHYRGRGIAVCQRGAFNPIDDWRTISFL